MHLISIQTIIDMKVTHGDRLRANCNYYCKVSGNKLFSKGNVYRVRIGTDGNAYVLTETMKSYELNVSIINMVFDVVNNNYDYAMAIL